MAVLWTTAACAWNDCGHMMVAAIAWDRLDPAVQVRAAELLKRNPEYQNWIQDISPLDRGIILFVNASTWPVFIKQAPGYQNDGEDPDSAQAPNQNIGYTDNFQHPYWHYIDLPFSTDGTPLIQPKAPNAQTQIEKFRATVASTAADDVKFTMLRGWCT